jgi:spore maturation protein SpmA
MLNYVWSFLLLSGLVAGALFGRLGGMVGSVFDVCKAVVLDIALPLAGTMMLWLGILRVMEKAGLMQMLARLMAPLMRLLFPDVPKDHPAMGAMMMNMAANLLGLGNSATPLGLKAMGHLQELNPNKQSASNAMCMFLAVNTAGLTLIPMSAINFLNAGRVPNPYSIIAPTLFATSCAAIVAVLSAKLLQRLPFFKTQPDDEQAADSTESPPQEAKPFKLSAVRTVILAITGVAFLAGVVLEFMPETRKELLQQSGMQALLDAATAKKKETAQRDAENKAASNQTVTDTAASPFKQAVQSLSVIAIPLVLLIAVLAALARGIPVYEEMVEGAKEGFAVATRIMPFLVIMLTALKIFSESGALLLLQYLLSPVLDLLHMPAELFPMAIMRPLSGSGSQGILNEIILNPSASGVLKYTAAIMYGSTETTFYVLAVYFGSVGIRRIRHALAIGLIADVVGMVCAITAGRILFGG